MRKSRAEAAETRCRIVDSASSAFREGGIEGTSLTDLMAAAGLTHGGFYRHFKSKDQLVAETCKREFEAMVESVREACVATPGSFPGSGPAGVIAVANAFLSTSNRDERAARCPFTSIGSELARADEATRHAATEGLRRAVDLLAQQFQANGPETARSLAVAALSAMVGGLTLARIVDDAPLSDTILADVKSLIERMAVPAAEEPCAGVKAVEHRRPQSAIGRPRKKSARSRLG